MGTPDDPGGRDGHPDRRAHRHPGDGWVECRCGAQHWGLFGAAGLLLADTMTERASVVLQHRALWSHHGGTWGIPGGALGPGESPVDGAVREAVEEAGIPEDTVRAWSASTLVHPDWSYTTIIGEALAPFTPAATDAESLEVAWVPVDDVEQRSLLPAFGHAWPDLVPLLGRRALLVVDGANVVGARPDGWWRDRAGAASRLHAALSTALPHGFPAAGLGLAGDHSWPDVTLVLEGAARRADVPDQPSVGSPVGEGTRVHPASLPTLLVARAVGSGDDAVVAVVAEALATTYTDVVVVTSDRELAQRARYAAPAGTTGESTRWVGIASPEELLAALDRTTRVHRDERTGIRGRRA